jgi:hypothetical protein
MRRISDFSDLQIDSVVPFRENTYKGFTIEWSSPSIGFGEYQIWFEKDENSDDEFSYIVYADTECMDKGEDKEFTKAILNLLVDKIHIYD